MINLRLRNTSRRIEGMLVLTQDSPAFFEDAPI